MAPETATQPWIPVRPERVLRDPRTPPGATAWVGISTRAGAAGYRGVLRCADLHQVSMARGSRQQGQHQPWSGDLPQLQDRPQGHHRRRCAHRAACKVPRRRPRRGLTAFHRNRSRHPGWTTQLDRDGGGDPVRCSCGRGRGHRRRQCRYPQRAGLCRGGGDARAGDPLPQGIGEKRIVMLPLIALLGALGTTAAAQVSYKKYSLGHGRRNLYLTVLLFGAAPPLTYLAVKGFGVGTVYISTSITYVLVALAGWRVFGERPTRRRVVAMIFIALGILVYGIGL